MYNKVFISYASEDIAYAIRLYDFLESNNYKPWLDKKDLIPGQQWENVIQSELRKADFIIILLSSKSVLKRGYVQREFNTAINYCEEKLDDDIYIIPIKIDECVVPEKLSKFQWVEYIDNESFRKILSALEIQKSRLLYERNIRLASENGFSITERAKTEELGEQSPRQVIDIKFQTVESKAESFMELNLLIENEVLKYVLHSRKNYFSYLKEQKINSGETESLFTIDSECFGNIAFTRTGNSFFSYKSFWSLYETGAAHGNYWTTGHNFYINPLRQFDFFSLFEDEANMLRILRDIIHSKLMDKAKVEFNITDPSDFYLLDEGLESKREYFDNYYFKESSIFFIYNPYQLTAFVYGDHHIEIPVADLLTNFKGEIKLAEFINTSFQ